MVEVIKKMIKSPGFTHTRRILSDEESALKSLEKRNPYFPSIKFITTNKKAKLVERTIRSLKLQIRKLMLINNDVNIKHWRRYLAPALKKLNTKPLKGKIPGQLETVRPIDLNNKNIGSYVTNLMDSSDSLFSNLHPIPTPRNETTNKKIFKFDIGDLVYIAKKFHPNRKIRASHWNETISFSGHFNSKNRITKLDDVFSVAKRWLETSSKGYVIPLYKLKQDKKIINFVYEYQIRPFPTKK